jgi:hypothetical protein
MPSRKKRTKTRRRQKRLRGGGKLNALPILGDTPEKKLEDLRNRWEMMLLLAHGKIVPGIVKVPANTYLMFNSPSGCRAMAMGGLPFRDIVVAHDQEEFLKKFLKSHEEKKELFQLTTPDIRQALSMNACYPEDFFTESGQFRRTTISKTLTQEQRLRTIYGPGESVNEMTLTFANSLFDLMYLGVFKLPIEFNYDEFVFSTAFMKMLVEKLNFQAWYKKSVENSEPKEVRDAKIQEGYTRTYEITHSLFGNVYGPNLRPIYVKLWPSHQNVKDGKADKSLSQVLAQLPPVPEGKVRFLYIGACRGIDCETPELAASLSRFVRRGSLSGSPEESSVALEAAKSLIKPMTN